MIKKHLLAADRERHPPREGFSWVDRRFLRDFSTRLSADAVLLYFFLCAVSDKQGLSFYSDTSIALRLRMREQSLTIARDELISEDLVAYEPPLTQVLSLPPAQILRGGREGLTQLFRVLGPTLGKGT